MDRKLKHLDFIQGVINRLSTNSFLLKGWSVLLVSALMALGTREAELSFILLAYFPAIVFWGLDGYFLMKERQYRRLYNIVRGKDPNDVDFCMDTTPVMKDAKKWSSAVLSPTLYWFHGVLVIAVGVVMFIQILRG